MIAMLKSFFLMKMTIQRLCNIWDRFEPKYWEKNILQSDILFTTYPSLKIFEQKHNTSLSEDSYQHHVARTDLFSSESTLSSIESARNTL